MWIPFSCPRCGTAVWLPEIADADELELVEEHEDIAEDLESEHPQPLPADDPFHEVFPEDNADRHERATPSAENGDLRSQRGREASPRHGSSRGARLQSESAGSRPATRPSRRGNEPPRSRKTATLRSPQAEDEGQRSHSGMWIGVGCGLIGVICLVITLALTLGDDDANDREGQQANLRTPETDTQSTAPAAAGLDKTGPRNPAGESSTPRIAQPGSNPNAENHAGQQPLPVNPPHAGVGGDGHGEQKQPKANGPQNVVPAPQGGNPVVVAPAGGRLKSLWQPGREYAYRIEITADLGNELATIRGQSIYELTNDDPRQLRGIPPGDVTEGTGSAFVIHPDGYLATCAHVVEDASEILVHLQGKVYAARVVAVNSAQDLAIIRVNARNLAALPLADSRRVELAETVRVVGFPLTDALGESVKITSGSVAGFVDRKSGQRVMQVDAPINPGNSGGPLVNQRGAVIGVASAKLTGTVISNVGFAVPSKDLQTLATKHAVQPTASAGGAVLPGPELARKVTPGVALLKVKIGQSGGKQWVLRHSGFFSTRKQPKQGVNRFPSFPESKHDRTRLIVNEYGEVLYGEEGANLPYVLGPLSQLALAPLSRTGQDNWHVEESTVLRRIQRENNSPFGFRGMPRLPRPPRFGPRLGPRGIDPFGRNREKVTVYLAEERHDFTLVSSDATGHVIEKKYELVTTDAQGGTPFLKMQGGGKIRLSAEDRLVKRINHTYRVQMTENNQSTTIPVTVSIERMTAAELLADRQAREKALAEAKQRAEERKQAANSPQKLQEHLATLKEHAGTEEFSKRFIALSALQRMTPTDHENARNDVLAAVTPLLEAANSSLKNTARIAFAKWAGAEQIDNLLALLNSTNSLERQAVITKLGELDTEKAAEALVARLRVSSDRFRAKDALKTMESSAEAKVLPLLDDADKQLVRTAVEILQVVGGKKSQAALQAKLMKAPDFSTRVHLERALKAMEKRLGKAKQAGFGGN